MWVDRRDHDALRVALRVYEDYGPDTYEHRDTAMRLRKLADRIAQVLMASRR